MIKCSLCGTENPDERFTCQKCGFPLRNIENLQPGEVLKGRFKIENFLGKGGMGVIYKAKDIKLKRRVAIKILPLELRSDDTARRRFLREAQTASILEHQNICIIHEIYESDDVDFIVMQFIEGKNLHEILKKNGKVQLSSFLSYAKQMASALSLAHSKGIIHRDIKPSNIMVTPAGQVKILDFGLAKFSKSDESLTTANTVVGTLAYMSPEQCKGEKLTPSTDIFSLGVVFYEMLTGKNPFRGGDTGSTFYKLLHETPPRPSNLLDEIPGRYDPVIMKCLEKDPLRRFKDGGELLASLNQLEELTPPMISQSSTLPGNTYAASKRGKWALPLIVLPILAVSILLAIIVLNMGKNPGLKNIVIRDFTVEKGISEDNTTAISYLLSQKLLLLEGTSIIDEEAYSDLRKRIKEEILFKKYNIIGLLSGRLKKYGKMYTLEVKLSQGDRIIPITISGEGIQSLLSYQIDSLGEKVAKLLNLKFRKRKKLTTMLTRNYKSLIYYLKAKKAWESLSVSGARKYINLALKKDSSFQLAHFLKAEILMFLEQTAGARKQVNLSLLHRENLLELDLWRIQSLKAELEMNFPAKINFLKKIARRLPFDKYSYYNLAEAYFHRASPKKAVEEYRKALEIKPDFSPALNHAGYCFLYLGEHLEGIQYFEKYKTISDVANAFDSLGDGYFYSGNYLEALTNKETALARDPSLDWVYGSIADILFLKGAIKQAFSYNKTYMSMVNGKKNLARAYIQRAYFREELGMEGAEEDIRKAKKLFDAKDPHNLIPELHWASALIYFKKHNVKKGCEEANWMGKVIKKNRIDKENYFPIYKYYLQSMAECLLKKQDKSGLEYYGKLMNIKEKLGYWATPYERAFFTAQKAFAEIRLGLLSRARRTLEDGFSYNPNHPLLLEARIRLLKKEGKFSEVERRIDELRSFYMSTPSADEDFLKKKIEELRK